jgi:hypothetical protein
MDAACCGEQRGVIRRREANQVPFSLPNLAFSVKIWGDDPLVQHQRMPRGVEDGAASMICSAPDTLPPSIVRFVHTARDLPPLLADSRDAPDVDEAS